jgi:acyl-CoA dehydrogenase
MNFDLDDDHRLTQDLTARFVREALTPLETKVLERDAAGKGAHLTEEETRGVDALAQKMGLWGLDAPADVGGMDLPTTAMVGVNIEMGRTCTPYHLPPDSPNLRMLMATVNEDQRARYLLPYVRDGLVSAIGISEPGAGADPAAMITTAVRNGSDYLINGRKIWISRAAEADFTILMAVTDKARGVKGGVSAFLVDRDTPGFNVLRRIPMIGGQFTYEIALEDCRVPAANLLGREGEGFAPMQLRLSTRRLQMAAWCIGMASRALEMMIEYAPQRSTFGQSLANRQAIQWWIADGAAKVRAARLMTYETAWKLDQGRDVRTDVSMVKVYATEMAWEILDNAMQTFGAMGMTKDLPLQLMAGQVRTMRIYDGPSEVHRWVVARDLLGLKR